MGIAAKGKILGREGVWTGKKQEDEDGNPVKTRYRKHAISDIQERREGGNKWQGIRHILR